MSMRAAQSSLVTQNLSGGRHTEYELYRWLENKTEEDYSVLYYDEAYIGDIFVTMEEAAREDSHRWASKMSAVYQKFRMLRLRTQHSSPQEEQLPAYEESGRS